MFYRFQVVYYVWSHWSLTTAPWGKQILSKPENGNALLANFFPKNFPQMAYAYSESNCLEERWMESHFQRIQPPPILELYNLGCSLGVSEAAHWTQREQSLPERSGLKLGRGARQVQSGQWQNAWPWLQIMSHNPGHWMTDLMAGLWKRGRHTSDVVALGVLLPLPPLLENILQHMADPQSPMASSTERGW